MTNSKPVIFYTDGACANNGYENSIGGFGVVGLSFDKKLLFVYNETCQEETTNNREEMKAIIYVVKNFADQETVPTIYSDSTYAIQTFSNWMFKWKENNWIKSTDKKSPENLDLILEFYDLYETGKRAKFIKVKGHNGDEWNELADKLATQKITCEEVKLDD